MRNEKDLWEIVSSLLGKAARRKKEKKGVMNNRTLVRKGKNCVFYELIDNNKLDELILQGQVDYEYVTDHYEEDKREGVRAVKKREYFRK